MPLSLGGDGKFSVPVYFRGMYVGVLRGSITICPKGYKGPLSLKPAATDVKLARASTSSSIEPLAIDTSRRYLASVGNASWKLGILPAAAAPDSTLTPSTTADNVIDGFIGEVIVSSNVYCAI